MTSIAARGIGNGAAILALLAVLACGPTSTGDPTGDGGQVGDGDGGTGGCQGASCQNHCPTGTQTTLTGVVTMPNGTDPVPGALVYVPSEVTEFPGEVSCEVCGQISDLAIVTTSTNDDGSFILGPIPTAENQQPGFPVQVVAQIGRFRKLASVVIDAPCAANTASASAFRLPGRTNGFDNIPRIAVATGDYDVMECVLLKIGLEQGAFDLYNGIGGFGSPTPNTQGNLDTLLMNLPRMKGYNIIFLNCADDTYENLLTNATIRHNVRDYVQSGGRLYVTDWSYDYVEQIEEFSPIIDFAPGPSSTAPEPQNAAAIGSGGITTEAQVLDDGLRRWLEAVEVVTGDEVIAPDGRVHIDHFLVSWVMQYAVPAMDNVRVWLEGAVSGSGLSGTLPLTTTFDYAQCGRVLYSSYHTAGRDIFAPADFPSYCSSDPLSPQERVLEYLILHIADCITIE